MIDGTPFGAFLCKQELAAAGIFAGPARFLFCIPIDTHDRGWAVAELARVQKVGEHLNSGDFSDSQESSPHCRQEGIPE
jgi:hypothetical protein